MKPKYAVFPGWIISQRDGDHHYIAAWQLMNLYGVKRGECKVFLRAEDMRGHDMSQYIPLVPRHDGDYSLPTTVGSSPAP